MITHCHKKGQFSDQRQNHSTSVPDAYWVQGLRMPCVYYVESIVDRYVADQCLEEFMQTMDWRTNEKTMNRWTALYGEVDEYRYGRTHAGKTGRGAKEEESDLPTAEVLPWTPRLLELKSLVEKWYLEQAGTPVEFTVCLANLYKDGTQGIAW